MKAGQRAEAGGPGGPRAKVQEETSAPRRLFESELGGRSSQLGTKGGDEREEEEGGEERVEGELEEVVGGKTESTSCASDVIAEAEIIIVTLTMAS